MKLSTRTKESIKTGLAMTIAYGISLAMGWDKPHWAGFAVAMISLSTAGQSLDKGFMRMLGTVLGVGMAFLLIALFPQQRWGFMMVVSVFIGFCTYMLTGQRYPYAWFVAAFVCLIIAVSSSADTAQTFQIGVMRLQETGLGILIYSLISVFIWKQSSAGPLNRTAHELVAVQTRLFNNYRGLVAGEDDDKASRPLRMQYVALIRQFGQILIGAEVDSYEVWEARHQWRRFQILTLKLMKDLERWRQDLPKVRQLGINALLPNLDAVENEVAARLAQAEAMLAGKSPEFQSLPMAVALDKTMVRSQSRFEKATVAVFKAQTEQIEQLSRELLDCVAVIRGLKRGVTARPAEVKSDMRFLLDPDRLQAVYRVMATLWIAFLLWIYLDPPGHSSFVQLTATMAMVFAMSPQAPPISLVVPFAWGCIVAGCLYVFVMPQLSGFAELGLIIFGYTFAVYYLFSQPRQILAKMGAIIAFLVLTAIENQQTYSFAKYANTSAMIMLSIILAVAVSYLPPSPRPEKICLRLVNRFFRQCEILISRLSLETIKRQSWIGRLEMVLYRIDLLKIPSKLMIYGQRIDRRIIIQPSAEAFEAVVNSLAILVYRINMLGEVHQLPQADLIVKKLREDILTWRLAIQGIFQNWRRSKTDGIDAADLQARLTSMLNHLEASIDTVFLQEGGGALNDEDNENFYRLLGGYRSLSEAVVDHARLVAKLNWEKWREERF
ncbi:MAG: FUSC family protein [Desulfobacterales bacterium]|jgi:uncharacterized membrane protein YccC